MKIKKIASIVSFLAVTGFVYGEYSIKYKIDIGSINISNKDQMSSPNENEDNSSVETKPLAVMASLNAPMSVFKENSFDMTFTSENGFKYKITSNNKNSGISTNGIEVNGSEKYSITPTAAGNYSYSVVAINEDGIPSSPISINVSVEDFPKINSFSINNATSFIHVAKNAALETIVSNSNGSTVVHNVPYNASSDPGETIYTAFAEKTLNGVYKKSDEMSFKVATGTLINLTVGNYNTNGLNGAPFLVGKIDLGIYNGYSAISVGGISQNTYNGYTINNIFQSLDGGSISIGFPKSVPDGIMNGSKIWVHTALCSNTTSIYTEPVDLYRFAECPIRLSKWLGETINIYY